MINYFEILFMVFVSFFISLFFVPFWIKKAKDMGLVWKDMHKRSNESISGSGGIIAIMSFVIGVLVFITYRTFILNTGDFLVEILAMLVVISFLAGIGFIDDLFGWQKGGMRKRHRLILASLASIPLMAINAGKSMVSLPFIGPTELGIIYPLVLIPLGIVGAATTFNFLAGFNGLEAGQGIILMVSLGIVSFLTGSPWLGVIAFIMAAALLGFLVYNRFPAKIFPGDSLTYGVGGLIAIIAILGNFERIALFFFIPYILETALKLRGNLTKESFGKVNEDGTLRMKYGRVYSLTHLSMLLLKKARLKVTEKTVVYSIWLFQILIIILGFILFRGTLI